MLTLQVISNHPKTAGGPAYACFIFAMNVCGKNVLCKKTRALVGVSCATHHMKSMNINRLKL